MNSLEIVPSVLDRIRKTLVGLKMPRALEVLDPACVIGSLSGSSASAGKAISHTDDGGKRHFEFHKSAGG
jgi:2-polyprenyl-3-methyl-5-hydroxy-6-metoxy-1,4-benzoquinol methylase